MQCLIENHFMWHKPSVKRTFFFFFFFFFFLLLLLLLSPLWYVITLNKKDKWIYARTIKFKEKPWWQTRNFRQNKARLLEEKLSRERESPSQFRERLNEKKLIPFSEPAALANALIFLRWPSWPGCGMSRRVEME